MKKILLLIYITIIALNGCSRNRNNLSNNESRVSTSIVNVYGKNLIGWEAILNQDAEEYYAYVFSYTCYYCNLIKNEVNMLAVCGDLQFYFVQFNESIPVKENAKGTIGLSEIEELYIVGTPTLFLVKEGYISECYLGYQNILNYISILIDTH